MVEVACVRGVLAACAAGWSSSSMYSRASISRARIHTCVVCRPAVCTRYEILRRGFYTLLCRMRMRRGRGEAGRERRRGSRDQGTAFRWRVRCAVLRPCYSFSLALVSHEWTSPARDSAIATLPRLRSRCAIRCASFSLQLAAAACKPR